jgi:hypothetical protein
MASPTFFMTPVLVPPVMIQALDEMAAFTIP